MLCFLALKIHVTSYLYMLLSVSRVKDMDAWQTSNVSESLPCIISPQKIIHYCLKIERAYINIFIARRKLILPLELESEKIRFIFVFFFIFFII